MNKTILERVRCMLSKTNLPCDFWAEAVATATYTINGHYKKMSIFQRTAQTFG